MQVQFSLDIPPQLRETEKKRAAFFDHDIQNVNFFAIQGGGTFIKTKVYKERDFSYGLSIKMTTKKNKQSPLTDTADTVAGGARTGSRTT